MILFLLFPLGSFFVRSFFALWVCLNFGLCVSFSFSFYFSPHIVIRLTFCLDDFLVHFFFRCLCFLGIIFIIDSAWLLDITLGAITLGSAIRKRFEPHASHLPTYSPIFEIWHFYCECNFSCVSCSLTHTHTQTQTIVWITISYTIRYSVAWKGISRTDESAIQRLPPEKKNPSLFQFSSKSSRHCFSVGHGSRRIAVGRKHERKW